MSMVLISNHNETIYDIDKTTAGVSSTPIDGSMPPHTEATRMKREILKEAENQKRKRKAYGVIGKPKEPLPDPKAFLRKRTGKVYAVSPDDVDTKKVSFPKKDPVPKTLCSIYEQMNKLQHHKKNFVQENVKNVLKMKHKEPIRKEYTDVNAVGFKIVPKEPEQVSNKIFAKIPAYLEHMIKVRQAQIERDIDVRGIVKQKCTYITRDERKILLEGLKKNWDELQRVYQGLPILTDTIPKKTRKRDLENQLQQLEKDIVLIERHPFIYVYDDEEDMH